MSGSIRTNEKCPKCRRPFTLFERVGFLCTACGTIPKRLRVDVTWKGKREKIYTNKQGQVLEGYHQALTLQKDITEEIAVGIFDPSKYRRENQKKFKAANLLEEFLEEKIGSIAPSYQDHYRRYNRKAAEFFASMDVREIRKIDLIGYQRCLEEMPVSRKTIKNYFDHFKVFLRWCRDTVEVIAEIKERLDGFRKAVC